MNIDGNPLRAPVPGGADADVGGALLGLFNNPNLLFELGLAGATFLYLGFIYSDRFIKAR